MGFAGPKGESLVRNGLRIFLGFIIFLFEYGYLNANFNPPARFSHVLFYFIPFSPWIDDNNRVYCFHRIRHWLYQLIKV